jgi:hypothetical protein
MTYQKTTKDFIENAREIHGEKYDYTPSIYVKRHSKIKIRCIVHGDFEQSANNHLKGSGCTKCKFDKLSKIHSDSTDQFVEKAKIVHGERYNYTEAEYKNRHYKVTIICNGHGRFDQNANDHLNGRGCPSCANEVRGHILHDDTTPGFLYVVEFSNDKTHERFLKVGITSNSPKIRMNNISNYETNIISEIQLPLGQAYKIEQQLLSKYKKMKYTPSEYFGGHTECLLLEALSSITQDINKA